MIMFATILSGIKSHWSQQDYDWVQRTLDHMHIHNSINLGICTQFYF